MQLKQTKKRKGRKSFHPKHMEMRLTLGRCRLLCSRLPAPAEGKALGAVVGRPRSHGSLPLKWCAAMCAALMFALYPPCKAIIIHAS